MPGKCLRVAQTLGSASGKHLHIWGTLEWAVQNAKGSSPQAWLPSYGAPPPQPTTPEDKNDIQLIQIFPVPGKVNLG